MIVWKDDVVVANGTLYMTDVFAMLNLIKPFWRKIRLKLQKEESIVCRLNNYTFEIYYATRIYNTFFKMMINDVINNNVLFKHSTYKSIYLIKETRPSVIRANSRLMSLIPTMPVYSVTLRMAYRGNFRYRRIYLFNELRDSIREGIINSSISEGIKQTKTAKDYISVLAERFPRVDKTTIETIIKEGNKSLYMPVRNYKVDLTIGDFDTRKKLLAKISNANSYYTMLPHYSALITFLQKFKKDNHFYAIFNEEQHKRIQEGYQYVSGLAIYTIAFVRLFSKQNKSGKKFIHIYKIKNSNRSSYKYFIQRKNVKTSRLEYIYRRDGARYEPINNAK